MNAPSSIIVSAPAKINLFLHVVGKREDGYHLLNSLVVFTQYGDQIKVKEADILSLEIAGNFANSLANSPQEENLVWKSAIALQKYTNSNKGAHILLTKNLPIGSGIGGGSADAAATIKALSKLWKLDISQEKLFKLALKLGSDVPVCLHGRSAFMRGIGEDLLPVKLQERIYIVLINPNVFLSTVEVFKDYSYNKNQFSKQKILPDIFIKSSYKNLSDLINEIEFSNDLEEVSIKKLPVIGKIIASLNATQDCFLARMSGSGATCFGLYYNKLSAHNAAKKLQKIYKKVWCEVTHTIDDYSDNIRG